MPQSKTLLSLLFVVLISGCSFNLETVEGMPEPEKAKPFSDKVVSLIINEKKDELYALMDSYFRKTYGPEVMSSTLEKVFDHFGKLVVTEFKSEEVVNWQYPDGSKKLARKYWYKAKTSKAEMGKYFVQVTVVKDGPGVACLSVSMLEFPQGIPDNLR